MDRKPIISFPGKPELGKPCPLGLLLPGEEFELVLDSFFTHEILTSRGGKAHVCETIKKMSMRMKSINKLTGFITYRAANLQVYPTHLIDTREIK